MRGEAADHAVGGAAGSPWYASFPVAGAFGHLADGAVRHRRIQAISINSWSATPLVVQRRGTG